MTTFFCPHCEQHHTHTQPIQKRRGPHLGLYCPVCGGWIKWVKRHGSEAQTAAATTEPGPESTLASDEPSESVDCPFETKHENVPCETCGKPTRYTGTKRCDNCWEVERRLEGFMVTPRALAFVRKFIPALDDWVDGNPDAWDYETILRDNNVTVEWDDYDKPTSDGVTFEPAPPDLCGWGFYWVHGAIHIGQTSEQIARKAAALFVSLWLRGVSASFCDKLMDGYICFLERQENKSLTFVARFDQDNSLLCCLNREGLHRPMPLILTTEHEIVARSQPSGIPATPLPSTWSPSWRAARLPFPLQPESGAFFSVAYSLGGEGGSNIAAAQPRDL